jgi:DNA-directed RNA polymerase subunit RPC12/RpoP
MLKESERSMVNMLEVLACDYCEHKGMVSPSQKAPRSVHKDVHSSRRTHVGAAT